MNEHDLLNAVGEIDGKYVENAAEGGREEEPIKEPKEDPIKGPEGELITQSAKQPQKLTKKNKITRWVPAIASLAAALVLLVGISYMLRRDTVSGEGGQSPKGQDGQALAGSQGGEDQLAAKNQGDAGNATTQAENDDLAQGPVLRRAFFQVDYDSEATNFKASVAPYQAASDLSNVKDADRYYFDEHELSKLASNLFVVVEGQSAEFFDIYEQNRYMQYPNFITSDSMMHTYHLYFAMLQKKVEKQSLCSAISRMTAQMLENSKGQYDSLKGSEWEEAAKLNVAYFGIASQLLGLDGQVPSYVSDVVDQEVRKIVAASGIETSLLTNDYEDYSQYKPRGYYDGDEQLERYFRAMMLYGHLNFAQNSETMNRCALLLSLAMKEDGASRTEWGNVYAVTAFFVGQSDDLGYYEYLPAIDKAYGENVTVKDLIGDGAAFQEYVNGIRALRGPEVNSMVFEDDGGQTDKLQESKGFRFMGQRFTMDAAVFTQLTYSKVEKTEDGDARMLPDGLDVPAAFGSDVALELLVGKGNDRYPNYLEQMAKVREKVQSAKTYWSSSLYGGWLYALMPYLETKGEGYPSFMTNKEWQKKSLEGYLGSWTELKHDTILYAKQAMAEMGGGEDMIYDDRGYVEPQPELYARLCALTKTTREGLEKLGYLGADEKDGLERLEELSARLRDISVKELRNEGLTDEEYELIRCYGGSLEHLWYDTVKGDADNPYFDSAEFPMALVADVATDPNGACLEEAIGGASRIYVIFPIDGELHVGIGGVFNYYQFEQPISDRLTDKEWRIRLGIQLDDNDEYRPDRDIRGPEWTDSYRYYWSDYYR